MTNGFSAGNSATTGAQGPISPKAAGKPMQINPRLCRAGVVPPAADGAARRGTGASSGRSRYDHVAVRSVF